MKNRSSDLVVALRLQGECEKGSHADKGLVCVVRENFREIPVFRRETV